MKPSLVLLSLLAGVILVVFCYIVLDRSRLSELATFRSFREVLEKSSHAGDSDFQSALRAREGSRTAHYVLSKLKTLRDAWVLVEAYDGNVDEYSFILAYHAGKDLQVESNFVPFTEEFTARTEEDLVYWHTLRLSPAEQVETDLWFSNHRSSPPSSGAWATDAEDYTTWLVSDWLGGARALYYGFEVPFLNEGIADLPKGEGHTAFMMVEQCFQYLRLAQEAQEATVISLESE